MASQLARVENVTRRVMARMHNMRPNTDIRTAIAEEIRRRFPSTNSRRGRPTGNLRIHITCLRDPCRSISHSVLREMGLGKLTIDHDLLIKNKFKLF